MTNIGPINSNTAGLIGGSYGFGAKPKTEQDKEAKGEINQASTEKSQVSGDAVLSYMANSAISSAPKTVDTTKYVDKESEARIARFMSDFEDQVVEGLAAFDKELDGVNLSDSAKMTAVLSKLNKES